MSTDGESRGPVGGGRGRLLAVVLAGASAVLFVAVALGPRQEYLALRFLHRPWGLIVVAVLATGLLVAAGHVVTRARPAATVVRVLTVLVAALLGLGVTVQSLFLAGFSDRVLHEEVLAVSPDGRHEVVRSVTVDWANVEGYEIRLRSRAWLLSRAADWTLEPCGVDGDRQVAFVDDRTVSIGAGNRRVTVTFDPGSMRRERVVEACDGS